MALKSFTASCEHCERTLFNEHTFVVSGGQLYLFCSSKCLYEFLDGHHKKINQSKKGFTAEEKETIKRVQEKVDETKKALGMDKPRKVCKINRRTKEPCTTCG
jgi:YHS domain-containing protein